MKVLLVIPPWVASRNRDFAVFIFPPHTGLAYIAAVLTKSGHEVRVIDAQAEGLSFREFGRRVQAFTPDLVGITSYTDQIEEAGKAARIIKENNPEIPIIVGGYHVSALPAETLEEFPHFDLAVQGEGEICLEELAEWKNGRRGLEEIAGIAYRSNGRILATPARPFMEDLDSLPFPAYELFPLEKYAPYRGRGNKRKGLSLSTSRGCPYSCIFCCRVMGARVRSQSPEAVLKNMKYLMDRFAVRLISFSDENFTVKRDRTSLICEGIQKSGWQKKMNFYCETRVDLVDRELLRELGRSGCSVICFGIESGAPEILQKAGKGIDLEQARNAVIWAREAGITTKANFILGYPYEDKTHLKATLDFALQLDTDLCVFAILIPFPGTRLMEMAQRGEGGSRLLSRHWSDYGKHMSPVYETQELPRSVLERWQPWAYFRFYFRGRKIWNLFRFVRLKLLAYYLFKQLIINLRPGGKD